MKVPKEQQITSTEQLTEGCWYCCFTTYSADDHRDGELVQYEGGAFYDENGQESSSAMEADFWVRQV